MRTIHISDTHLQPLFRRRNSDKLESLLRRVLDEGFDHLAITGDLTHNADLESLRALRDILRGHGLLRSDRTTVVPGNHDIFGTLRRVSDLLRFPRLCAAVDVGDRLQRFRDVLGDLFEGAMFLSPDRPFPFVKAVQGVSFIGLNSNAAYSRITNLFASEGGIKDEDLDGVGRLLQSQGLSSRPKILLAHHGLPKNGRGRGREREGRLHSLRELGVGAVLHGHIHEMTGGRRDGLVIANAGASVDNGEPDAFHFNEVDYDGRRGLFRVSLRRGTSPAKRTRRLSGRLTDRRTAGNKLQTVYEGG